MVQLDQFAARLACELALYSPDIVTLSESPSERTTQRVAELLQMHHVRFPGGGHWPGTLLSRFPILDSSDVPLNKPRPNDLFTRHWGRAVLRIADGVEWIVHSAHLFPTADPAIRLREIAAMIATMEDDLAADRSMVLMGDLNHGPETDEYRSWVDAGWQDTFPLNGDNDGGRAPTDEEAQPGDADPGLVDPTRLGLTIPANQPQWRIDYVMVSPGLARHVRESRPLFEGAFRPNRDDPQSFSLSDHLPQLARIAFPSKP